MVEGARLESVYTSKAYREFESLRLRKLFFPILNMGDVYITHITPNYLDLAINLARSVRVFSNKKILIYCLNPGEHREEIQKRIGNIDNVFLREIELDIEEKNENFDLASLDKFGEKRESSRFFKIISAKTIALEMALEEGYDRVCYLDSDCLATPLVDEIFEWSYLLEGYPLGTEGIHEYMVMMKDGVQKGNPFEFSWPTPDNTLSLEWPIMNFMLMSPDQRGRYRTTNIMLADRGCLDFIKIWREFCYLLPKISRVDEVAPFHEETIYNALHWKYGNNGLPLCYVNLYRGMETVKEFYSEDIKGGETNYGDPNNMMWFYKIPDEKRLVKVLHGEKNIEVSNSIIDLLDKKFSKDRKTAIIIFSHSDTPDRVECLRKSISSVKKLNIPVFLSSGIEVPEDVMGICDGINFIDKNVLFKDSDIIKEGNNVSEKSFYFFDTIGQVKTWNRLGKKTYQSAVINHYITGLKYLKEKGFQNFVLWEYDAIMGNTMADLICEKISEIESGKTDCFFFHCLISGIPACFANPSIFKIDDILGILGDRMIEKAGDYLDLTNLQFIESLIFDKVIERVKNKTIYDLSTYDHYTADSQMNLYHPEEKSFYSVRCGLFVHETDDDSEIIYKFMMEQGAKGCVKFDLDLYCNGERIDGRSQELCPGVWFYFGIKCSYSDIIAGEKIIKAVEKIDGEFYEYELNSSNIEFYRKARKFNNI